MGYIYENSNPERFQQLCQSLFSSEFPLLQCYPVGQPDGGRDGWDPESRTVLQVKYHRLDEEENADWMIRTLEKEKEKILRLVERGATSYVMATNARGTAHLDAGRIDLVQKWLDTNLPIQATCLWRDDIDRRVDKASPALKLKYSEIITLEDGIELVVAAVLGGGNERQKDALRAFIAAQFGVDRNVKFKQISLSNDLLDLFIDVPVGLPSKLLYPEKRPSSATTTMRDSLMNALGKNNGVHFEHSIAEGNETLFPSSRDRRGVGSGTAEFLLSSGVQEHLKLIVLEGAPGQGKSTLAQFVCQVHRARFLQKREVLERIGDAYRSTEFRIPVKIDLRDFAAMLDGKSPFAMDRQSDSRTLDTFIAQLISHNSGGIEFNTHDWLSVVKHLPVLLFLDGLDEVPDMAMRQIIVDAIGDSLARWAEFNSDVQAVVTSRPSIFGRSPSFEKYGFATLKLRNLDEVRTSEYAQKWVRANELDDFDSHDVIKILNEKLELAHIRELTRNPMQLTILLSLIHQVGHSLPDQRTDLYRRYLELFLTREADKSARVREHQPILIGFIQYLAWVLQVAAESSKSAGSISANAIQDLAREYLRDRGRSEALADDLFDGGLERIFVLVERIEGLYEFEVQPLREYFCAQHLYTTAPVGTYLTTELHGDRAQRFEALAANPFWLNVCRFYAGSYTRAEKASLVYSLDSMISHKDPSVAIHARSVALALLQDWVFSDNKRPQEALVKAVFDDVGTQLLVASMGRNSEELTLHVECGQEVLRTQVFDQLCRCPFGPEFSTLADLLRINGGENLVTEFLSFVAGTSNNDRSNQLTRLFRSGAAATLTDQAIWELITADKPDSWELQRRSADYLRAEPRRFETSEKFVDIFVGNVLSGRQNIPFIYNSPLSMFAVTLLQSPGSIFSRAHFIGDTIPTFSEWSLDSKSARDVRSFFALISEFEIDVQSMRINFREIPEVWSRVAEAARCTFGENWASFSLSIRSAGIANSEKPSAESKHLFDTKIPICARSRSARLRRGGPEWWINQLSESKTVNDRMWWAGLVIMWTSPDNLRQLTQHINAIVDSIDIAEFEALSWTIRTARNENSERSDRKKIDRVDLTNFSNRAALLVSLAFGRHTSEYITTKELRTTDPYKSYVEKQNALDKVADQPSWKDPARALLWAQEICNLRRRDIWPGHDHSQHLGTARLNQSTAKEVVEDYGLYPDELVGRSVAILQRSYKAETLAAVSDAQKWEFE